MSLRYLQSILGLATMVVAGVLCRESAAQVTVDSSVSASVNVFIDNSITQPLLPGYLPLFGTGEAAGSGGRKVAASFASTRAATQSSLRQFSQQISAGAQLNQSPTLAYAMRAPAGRMTAPTRTTLGPKAAPTGSTGDSSFGNRSFSNGSFTNASFANKSFGPDDPVVVSAMNVVPLTTTRRGASPTRFRSGPPKKSNSSTSSDNDAIKGRSNNRSTTPTFGNRDFTPPGSRSNSTPSSSPI
jgi:hypothetical protein